MYQHIITERIISLIKVAMYKYAMMLCQLMTETCVLFRFLDVKAHKNEFGKKRPSIHKAAAMPGDNENTPAGYKSTTRIGANAVPNVGV